MQIIEKTKWNDDYELSRTTGSTPCLWVMSLSLAHDVFPDVATAQDTEIAHLRFSPLAHRPDCGPPACLPDAPPADGRPRPPEYTPSQRRATRRTASRKSAGREATPGGHSPHPEGYRVKRRHRQQSIPGGNLVIRTGLQRRRPFRWNR